MGNGFGRLRRAGWVGAWLAGTALAGVQGARGAGRDRAYGLRRQLRRYRNRRAPDRPPLPAPYVNGRYSNGANFVDGLQAIYGLPGNAVANYAVGGAQTGTGNVGSPLLRA